MCDPHRLSYDSNETNTKPSSLQKADAFSFFKVGVNHLLINPSTDQGPEINLQIDISLTNNIINNTKITLETKYTLNAGGGAGNSVGACVGGIGRDF